MSHYPEEYLADMINDNVQYATNRRSGLKKPPQETPQETPQDKLTGGSSNYYKMRLMTVANEAIAKGENIEVDVECMDIIEYLNLSYSEANIVKAIWRQAASRQGNGKAGTTLKYDREKCVYFSNRLLLEVL